MNKRVINPWTWQDQFGFVQATEVTDGKQVLYCAGQTAIDAEGHAVHAGDMAAQLTFALDNLEIVLKASGYTLSDVVRLNFYTTDVDRFIASIGPAAEPRIVTYAAAWLRLSGTTPTVYLLLCPRLGESAKNRPPNLIGPGTLKCPGGMQAEAHPERISRE